MQAASNVQPVSAPHINRPMSQTYSQIAALGDCLDEEEQLYVDRCCVDAIMDVRQGNRYESKYNSKPDVKQSGQGKFNSKESTPKTKKVGYNTCFYCKEEGHLRADCPKLKEVRARKNAAAKPKPVVQPSPQVARTSAPERRPRQGSQVRINAVATASTEQDIPERELDPVPVPQDDASLGEE